MKYFQVILSVVFFFVVSCDTEKDAITPRERYMYRSSSQIPVLFESQNRLFVDGKIKAFELRSNQVLRAWIDVVNGETETNYELYAFRFIPNTGQYIPDVQNYYEGRIDVQNVRSLDVGIILSLQPETEGIGKGRYKATITFKDGYTYKSTITIYTELEIF